MKKIIALICLSLMVSSAGFSQSENTSVNYDKSNKQGLMLELPYNETIAEGFIIDNLKKTGYDPETKGKLFWKQNKLNGFYVFKEVKLEGAGQAVDLYFKVDQKSRKAKDQSVIYMLVSIGGEDFISPGSNERVFNAARKFLNGFPSQSAAYKLDLDIKTQEEVVKTSEKKLNRLKDDEKELNKKIEQLQKDLKSNQKDQETEQKNLEDQKKKLIEITKVKA